MCPARRRESPRTPTPRNARKSDSACAISTSLGRVEVGSVGTRESASIEPCLRAAGARSQIATRRIACTTRRPRAPEPTRLSARSCGSSSRPCPVSQCSDVSELPQPNCKDTRKTHDDLEAVLLPEPPGVVVRDLHMEVEGRDDRLRCRLGLGLGLVGLRVGLLRVRGGRDRDLLDGRWSVGRLCGLDNVLDHLGRQALAAVRPVGWPSATRLADARAGRRTAGRRGS